jgi:hypothetical protein
VNAPGHPRTVARRLPAETAVLQLLYSSFEFFTSRLRDSEGRPLVVAAHHRDWCKLFLENERLVLLAPRDHGKTTLEIAYLLWRCWRRGRNPATGKPIAGPTGSFSAVLVSATQAQAEVALARFMDLIVANEWLFEDLLGPRSISRRERRAWASGHVRLANGAELQVNAFRTSRRGLHPDLLILDDVLSDQNSGSSHQRDLSWRYLVGTLLPMHPRQVLVVGTAFHQDDLLHRLGAPASAGLGFAWAKYRAIDLETETALWPERHSYRELMLLREAEPTIFSREYQNDPRDDAAAIFPFHLTQHALDAGAELTFLPGYRGLAEEVVVLGLDVAISEAAGADFTVVIVAAYEKKTGRRRVLTARRLKGLSLDGQVTLLCRLMVEYGVDLAIVEDNGAQHWLLDAIAPWPAIAARVLGFTTSRAKNDLEGGVLSLKLVLLADQWVMPCADAESRAFARTWQAELSAFGWKDGRLEGLGEHDDTVMATWFIERAIWQVKELLASSLTEELVYAEDLGIERVRISLDLDAADALARWPDSYDGF